MHRLLTSQEFFFSLQVKQNQNITKEGAHKKKWKGACQKPQFEALKQNGGGIAQTVKVNLCQVQSTLGQFRLQNSMMGQRNSGSSPFQPIKASSPLKQFLSLIITPWTC